jgi:exosortase
VEFRFRGRGLRIAQIQWPGHGTRSDGKQAQANLARAAERPTEMSNNPQSRTGTESVLDLLSEKSGQPADRSELQPAAHGAWLHHASFAGLFAASFLIFHRAWGLVIHAGLTSDQYSHIMLVLPLSCMLVYQERERVFARAAFCRMGVALLLFVAVFFLGSLALWPAVRQNNFIPLSLLCFVTWCIAAFIFSYGTTAFRRALFPLLFLVLMVPLPHQWLLSVITFLQVRSTDAACMYFNAAHVPFVRHGVILVLPKITIEVAKECSGIRSSLIMFISAVVLAHLFLRRTWQQLFLPLLSIPVTIVKNGLRIFTLSMLGMYVDPSFLTGNLHHHGGIVFFAMGFAFLAGVVWLFRKFDRRREGEA